MAKTLATAVVAGPAKRLEKQTVELPEPGPSQLLVKVLSAAQNPTDVKSFDNGAFDPGVVPGCDFAGIVEQKGSGVSGAEIGDKVAGFIWGREEKGRGAFSTHCVAENHIFFRLPENVTTDEAATVPLAAATAWLALLSTGCLAIPRASGSAVLVWGGNSSVGRYAIQLARILGFPVVTTCSPKANATLTALGADATLDYNDPDVVQKIRAAYPGLQYAFDTIGDETSSTLSGEALSGISGANSKLCTVRPDKAYTEDVPAGVDVSAVLVWAVFLKDYTYGGVTFPPSVEDHELGVELFAKLPGLMERGELKPNEVIVVDGGLDGVESGFELFRKGGIKGAKVVYRIASE